MSNILSSKPCKIISINKESLHEYTFRVETDIVPEHGQFMELSIPKFGEAPISVSGFGSGYMDFTIRSVGKVTDEIFRLKKGDKIYLRGPYGKGWPVDKFKDKHIVVVAGGTGVAPVRSMINQFLYDNEYVKSLNLLFGFKDSQGVLFKNELIKWKDKFNTVYTLDNENVDGFESGLVTAHLEKVFKEEFWR